MTKIETGHMARLPVMPALMRSTKEDTTMSIVDQTKVGVPMSMCTCGHTGDVKSEKRPNISQHVGIVGHGACVIPNCSCIQFTWKRHLSTEEREEFMNESLRQAMLKSKRRY